jgi:predicted ester cyclase
MTDRAPLARVVEACRNAFPNLEGTLEDQTAENDKVVNRYTGRGAHRGEYLGVAPTGREVELSGVTIFRLSGGKIVEGWDFYGGLGLLCQLGAMPALGEEVEPSH